MSVVDDYVSAADNAAEYSNQQIEQLKQRSLEDQDNLFYSVDERDSELWEQMGVDSDLTVADYEKEEIDSRGIAWSLGLAGIAAASRVQFFLDNREETIVRPIAYKVQKLEPFKLSRGELVRAGKRSVNVVVDEAYEALQDSIISQFDWVRRLDNSDLYSILIDNGSLRPAEKSIIESYVARMTDYPSGSSQFKSAVNDLINTNSNRGLIGMNRRTVQTLYTEREVDGDFDKLMVWVLEPGNNCEECLARAGDVRSYREWEQSGLPGWQVCLGGGYCNCYLASWE